jgi:hypothetical protein
VCDEGSDDKWREDKIVKDEFNAINITAFGDEQDELI